MPGLSSPLDCEPPKGRARTDCLGPHCVPGTTQHRARYQSWDSENICCVNDQICLFSPIHLWTLANGVSLRGTRFLLPSLLDPLLVNSQISSQMSLLQGALPELQSRSGAFSGLPPASWTARRGPHYYPGCHRGVSHNCKLHEARQ